MQFEEVFPLRFLINLGRREDRRTAAESQLSGLGLSAERFPAVDARRINRAGEVRGYENAGRYALAITQRLALREAAKRGAPSVLLLEDDVVLHPNLRTLFHTVDVPDDWGILYLGCAHHEKPEWAGRRLVRTTAALDTHAVAIRRPYFRRVMEVLDRHNKEDLAVAKASDQFLATLHREIPTYACYPNLAWQEVSSSDLIGVTYSQYSRDGLQKQATIKVGHLLPELVGATSTPESAGNGESPMLQKPRLGLLFLSRGDVNHPEIWQEFVAQAPDRVGVFSHPKFPDKLPGGFLDNTAISARHDTEWGDISLVRATRSLLLEALQDETLTHFALLSESCVPVRSLPEILRHLERDPRSQFEYARLGESTSQHADRIAAVPEVPPGCWRFQSQWWMMDRTAACFSVGMDYTNMFEKMFAADESYFATVLALQGYPLEGLVKRSCSTWTWWEKGAGSPETWPVLSQEHLDSITSSGAFFARKFPPGADIGGYRLHRAMS